MVSVAVRDMTSKYGSKIIYTELECTDYLTFIKTARSEGVSEGSYMDYIKSLMYGRFNIVIKERGKVIYAQAKRKEDENVSKVMTMTGVNYETPFPQIMFDPIDQIIGQFNEKDTAPKGSRTYGEIWGPAIEGTWFVDDTHPIYDYLTRSKGVLNANRSGFVVLQSLFRKCPRGPWFITGRGETLLIHNRDLGKKVYKQYTYKAEPSQLIDFTAKTKFEAFDKQVVSYSGMDPKERKNFFVTDYRKALYGQRNPKEILEDKEISEEDATKELQQYFDLRDAVYPKWGIDLFEGIHLRPVPDLIRLGPQDYSDNPMLRAVQKVKAETMADPWLLHMGIVRYSWYTMPIESYSEAVNVMNSRQREMAMDKEEGKIIIQGDPWVISEYTIRVLNVHKQHEGQYYIKKCEHALTSQGYKTTLDCIKVVPGSIMTTIGGVSKEEYDAMDDVTKEVFTKQYKREQELFGPEVKVTYFTPKTMASPYGYGSGPSYTSYEDKVQSYASDEDIPELIRLSKVSGSIVNFNPESK